MDDIFSYIEKIKKQGYMIVVEGKKDKESLEKIGFGNIFVLHKTRKSLKERIEEICKKTKRCIILTDMDKEGKKLYLFLKKELSEKGVKVNSDLRSRIIKLNVSHIEGLDSFLKKNENKKRNKDFRDR